MKLSNIRIEKDGVWSRLTVDVKAKYTSANKLWYAVPNEYAKWLSDDVYDAFLVSALYPAMYYNEPIEIDGNVSKGLFFNLKHYVQYVVKEYRPDMHFVEIYVTGFADAKQDEKRCGTGFSAGVDSFITYRERYELETDPDLKVSALFFFNVGSHGGGGKLAHRLFENRYELLKPFPEERGLPFIKLDSNLFDFYLKRWEYDAGIFCRAAAILTLQRGLYRYYISSGHAFSEWMTVVSPKTADLVSLAEGFLTPMLSTDKLKIIVDGAQYTRTQKIEKIADLKYVRDNLNVCVRHDTEESDAHNCSICSKCLRTLIILEALGLLKEYSNVFNIEAYKKVSWRYKCELVTKYGKDRFATENIDFAKTRGVVLPSYKEAINMICPKPSFTTRLHRRCGHIARNIFGGHFYNKLKRWGIFH